MYLQALTKFFLKNVKEINIFLVNDSKSYLFFFNVNMNQKANK